MKDLKTAREKGDLGHSIRVLGHCTRKNVGGVMSNEVREFNARLALVPNPFFSCSPLRSPQLFAFTNSGEPKFLVSEFVEEVCNTLQWITDKVIKEEEEEEGKGKGRKESEEEAAQSISSQT